MTRIRMQLSMYYKLNVPVLEFSGWVSSFWRILKKTVKKCQQLSTSNIWPLEKLQSSRSTLISTKIAISFVMQTACKISRLTIWQVQVWVASLIPVIIVCAMNLNLAKQIKLYRRIINRVRQVNHTNITACSACDFWYEIRLEQHISQPNGDPWRPLQNTKSSSLRKLTLKNQFRGSAIFCSKDLK